MTVFSIEATALWACFALGCLTFAWSTWREVLAVSGICLAATVLLGLFGLSVIQHFFPPQRLMQCPGCAYELRALTSDLCPECGAQFTAACTACGCSLGQMADGVCPDCHSVFGPGTVLIEHVGPAA